MATAAENVDSEPVHAGQAAGPCVMVLFGASGDLTMRKLVPALYNLVKAKLLPSNFAVVGVSHDDLSVEQFRTQVTQFLQKEDHERIRKMGAGGASSSKSLLETISIPPGR